jgi:hypothetical protein
VSLEDITAAPSEFKVGDKTYRVGPFRFYERGIIDRYIREHARSPLQRALVELRDLSPEERKPFIAEAREATLSWRPPYIGDDRGRPILCPECGSIVDRKPPPPSGGDDDWEPILLGSLEGQRFFLRTLLSIHQGDVNDADIDLILKSIDLQGSEFRRLQRVAFDMRDDDPKATAGDGSITSGSSASSSTTTTVSPKS